MSEEGIPTPEKNSHTGLIVAIVLVVIVVLLALFFGLYFGLRNKGNDIPDEVNPDPDIVEPGPEDPDSTGEDTPEHSEHSWVWEHDDEGHWQVCTVCGETTTKENHELTYTEQDSEYHIATCDICGYETTDEHTWVITSTDPATCTTSGTAYYKCEFCEATKTEVIEPLGHDPSSDWSSDESGHWHACLRCDEKLDYAAHTLVYKDNGNGTHTQYCSVCDYVIKTESHDIEYSQINGNETDHTESCKYCDYTATVAHTFDGYINDGDSGHHQVCTECHYTTATTSHDLGSYISDGENGHYKECSECDYRTNDEAHNLSYVSVDDTYHHQACSECSYTTEDEEHSYGEETLKVKDTSTIAYVSTCETCGHTKEVDQAYTFAFSTDSWEIIDAVATSGLANQIYTVGDTKTIYVGEEEHSVRIIDFNHDDLTDTDDNGYGDSNYNGGKNKAAITCDMVDCLSTTHYVTAGSGYNGGGWYSCLMRSYLNSDSGCVLSTLDDDLQSVIKKVDKESTAGNKSTALGTTASDSLFLLAEVELDGTTTTGYKDEGTQYTYWKSNSSTTARIKNLSDSAHIWFLRSPSTAAPNNWCIVNASGSITANSSSNSYGVSFAFCI